jgi:glycosyltransferase involved in cell wall biosynthesis
MSVTIGIPIYNGEKYLAQAIESALNQTIKPKEILIVNDGSTDRTEEIALSYLGAGNPIAYSKNSENKGIGYTRNKIIGLCKTDFLYFLSADDMLLPHAVETMLSYFKAFPDCFFYSDFLMIDENSNELGASKSLEFKDYNQFIQTCIESAKEDKMFVTYIIGGAIELWKKAPFWDNKRFGEDLAHLLECILIKNIKFIHIPFPLFKYRLHKGMVTQQKWNDIHTNNLETFRKINILLNQRIFVVE